MIEFIKKPLSQLKREKMFLNLDKILQLKNCISNWKANFAS